MDQQKTDLLLFLFFSLFRVCPHHICGWVYVCISNNYIKYLLDYGVNILVHHDKPPPVALLALVWDLAVPLSKQRTVQVFGTLSHMGYQVRFLISGFQPSSTLAIMVIYEGKQWMEYLPLLVSSILSISIFQINKLKNYKAHIEKLFWKTQSIIKIYISNLITYIIFLTLNCCLSTASKFTDVP